jgi:hypothetical protein
MTTVTTRSGRGWAYTGAISGGLVSIAANVAHSFIPPHGAPDTWRPEFGAVVGAIVWPCFLFIAVEILARVAWPAGLVWHFVRWAGLLPVAVVAALVSYRHLSGLLAHYGEEPIVYHLGPLAVDGLMVMATGALLATGRHHTTQTETNAIPTVQPINQLSTVDNQAVPSTVAGPATTFNPSPDPQVRLSPSYKDSDSTGPAQTPEHKAAPEAEPVTAVKSEVPTPAELAARITPPRPTPAASPAVSRPATRTTERATTNKPSTPAPTLAPSTTDTPVTASDAAQLTLPVVPGDLLVRAGQVARQYRTEHGAPITPGQLAVRLKVSTEEASQALAVLDLDQTDRNSVIGTTPNRCSSQSPCPNNIRTHILWRRSWLTGVARAGTKPAS